MENDKFAELGKNFYAWQSSNKLKFTFSPAHQGLEDEIKRVSELIDYIKEKIRIKGN